VGISQLVGRRLITGPPAVAGPPQIPATLNNLACKSHSNDGSLDSSENCERRLPFAKFNQFSKIFTLAAFAA
jgi:hypothetical protein